MLPSVTTLQILLLGSVLWQGPEGVELPVRPQSSNDGNRLTYLDQPELLYVDESFPKLTTPQWVGEPEVEAVVILAIDDLRNNTPKYEAYLRPILERLKEIDGRAPVSIMTNQVDPMSPQVQDWLAEGLSMEVHTLDHPCPLLQGGDFENAERNYHGGVELLYSIPNNRPVAFRMPCCDSMNSPSPRFYQEIFNERTEQANFLSIDSSICILFTPDDPDLPDRLVRDDKGNPRFDKYLPSESFVTTIENYPYPYLINKLCWEFPCMVPSDWEAQNYQGVNNPETIEDWKRALDATVFKQGVFTMVFHPHGWIKPEQVVEFIDYADRVFGSKIRFLTFKEAEERLTQVLLDGQAIRSDFGRDNGVRLIDLDNDGYLDLVMSDGGPRRTKRWLPELGRWEVGPLPTNLIGIDGSDRPDAVRFGIIDRSGTPMMVGGQPDLLHCWTYQLGRWVLQDRLIQGLPQDEIDGLRFRDLDGDGITEAIVANEMRILDRVNGVYWWDPELRRWSIKSGIPLSAYVSGFSRLDPGTRYLDLDGDGIDNDLIFSNESQFGAFVFQSKELGWGRIVAGTADQADAIPPIVQRFGQNNGFFATKGTLWWQNENTATLPDHVQRLSIESLFDRGSTEDAP